MIVTLLQLRKYLFGWSPIFLLVIFVRLINKLFKFGKDVSIVVGPSGVKAMTWALASVKM
jgi:hypothetical protein